ncbi:potassium channel family protein [Desulfogranum japonicum]|uniref:potassium channel family protein n=1 Tax=Desulfogranum japonicum TaxID=231447 RepID=UPI00041DF0D8|nr:NAD-binding protein [Desulfogranum japonicum]
MRIVFIGAGKVSIGTARELINKGHEVIIIERNKLKIDELSKDMDCSFLLGDGSHPKLLNEVNPPKTDFLFCLTDSDQANVIASLVGRSLGFTRIVTSIADPQYESICHELGLKDTIIPFQTISRYLADMVDVGESVELSGIIKDEARLFSFVFQKNTPVLPRDLQLPAESRVVCYYREGKFSLADGETLFRAGDEIVLITHSKNVHLLQEYCKQNADTTKAEGN